MKHSSKFDRRAMGFTLIEVLVASSVLVLMVALIGQLFSAATAVATRNNSHLDADSQARLVMDRMGYDFARMVRRTDVDYYFKKNANGSQNDECAFYSESTGYYPGSVTDAAQKGNVSLVGYRINNYQLERLSKALIWNASPNSGGASTSGQALPMVFLPNTLLGTWPDIAANGSTNGTDTNYQVIGDQVLRLEFTYWISTYTPPSSTTNNSPTLSGQPWDATYPTPAPTPTPSPTPSPMPAATPIPHQSISGMQDVLSVVVSMAVLDTRSRAIAGTAGMDKIIRGLADTPATAGPFTATPAQNWRATINASLSGGTAASTIDSSVPKAAVSQIHVYERYLSPGTQP